jgi:hypothetical protein
MRICHADAHENGHFDFCYISRDRHCQASVRERNWTFDAHQLVDKFSLSYMYKQEHQKCAYPPAPANETRSLFLFSHLSAYFF